MNAPTFSAGTPPPPVDSDSRVIDVRTLVTRLIADGQSRPQVLAAARLLAESACDPPLDVDTVQRVVAEAFARLALFASASPSPGDWTRPQDIFRDIVAAPYSLDDVPEQIATFADAFSRSSGFDASALALACIVSAAAVIDDRYRLAVRHGSSWFESARLWGVLLGGPSAGKSPVIRAASDALKHMHDEAFRAWAASADEAEDARDPRPCLYTSDATLEALSDVLRGNPRGVLMLTEEFASWIGSIDAYRNGQGSRDRGEMLQLYDGGPHQVNRVKRGAFLIPNWGASVLAAGTPAGLRSQVKQLPDDGLIHRFLPCIMRRPIDGDRTSARDATEAWDRTLRRVYTDTTTASTAQRARLTAEAAAVFESEASAIREATHYAEALAPALASHLGKHPGMLARLALVYHVLRGERTDGIAASTVEMAARFLRTARKHAATLYLDILATSPVRELARGVARSIAAGGPPEFVTRAWLSSHCRPFRDASDYHRRAAVEFLEDAHWIRPDAESRPYAGWPATSWEVNPMVAALYATVGDEHRQRRANVRSAILGDG